VDIVVTKKSIAIIYKIRVNKILKWKIAFGLGKKKVILCSFSEMNDAIVYAKKAGFGGYRLWYSTKRSVSIDSILNKEVIWKTDPIMFSHEKNWLAIYNARCSNLTQFS
jgi:hypothetical protein